MTKHRILVVDDEQAILESLTHLLSDRYDVFVAFNGESALEMIKAKNIELVITDLIMPGMDGIELLEKIKENYPSIPVIIVTGQGTISKAVEALKKGASDFIEKPLQVDKLLITLENIFKIQELSLKEEMNKRKLLLEEQRLIMVTENPNLKKYLKKIKALKNNTSNVLISGSEGTGKELLAKLIHKYSNRREYPFVKVNCNFINIDNFDTVLISPKKNDLLSGLFKIAEGGTLFLDHVDGLDKKSQEKLANILQTNVFIEPGTGEVNDFKARIIATTNESLDELVENGDFNEELYYLLNILHFNIPDLANRKEDIMPIANHFLEIFAKETKKKFKGFTIEVENIFRNYSWPGNVRELENVVERAVITSDRISIGAKLLPVGMKFNKRSPEITLKLYTESMEEAEEALIRYTMQKYEGNIMKASTAMGITRATLYNKIKRYHLDN